MPANRVSPPGGARIDAAVDYAPLPVAPEVARRFARPASRREFTAVHGPWIVVPTYNEIDNLEPLVTRLASALRETQDGFPFAVLVVDDGSPDGTGSLAEALADDYPEVQVLHRTEKSGLGQAYLAGFAVALEHGATHVIQMDADLSHDPADVPALLTAADDAGLVLGSRYVRGGATPDWPLRRRLLSRGGSMYARRLLGLRVRDLTGGFKCWSRQVLLAMDLDAIRSGGYVFQIEMTYRAVQTGARVAELPIVFKDRMHGQSKMSSDIVREAFMRVPQLRLKRAPRAAVRSTLEPAFAES